MTNPDSLSDRRAAILRSIADFQPDPLFVLDAAGNYLDCIGGNDRSLYDDPSFLVGLNMRDVLPPAVARRMLDEVHRALESNSLVVVEYQLGSTQVEGSGREGPDDSQWFEGRIVPLNCDHDGERCVAWLAINISDRKRAERALREREAHLRELSEVMLTAERLARVWSWEWDIANDLWRTLGDHDDLPVFPPSTTSNLLADYVHPEDQGIVREAVDAAIEGRSNELEHRIIDPKSGEIHSVRSFATVIRDETGTAVKLRGATQDITEQRRAEEQARYAENLRMTGRLAGGFAHEFNNLLQVVQGTVDIARRHPGIDPKLTKLFNGSAAAIRRGATLTGNLLAFSRRQLLDPMTVEPAFLIRRAADMLGPTLGQEVRLELDLADDLPEISVDTTGLETALLNLALNSVAAMPEGGTLVIRARRTRVGAAHRSVLEPLASGDYLEIVVADTGCGMSDSLLAEAFEPFFTTREVGKGAGLGLSMVQGFIRQSHGAVSLESREGEGTTARILLPAAPGVAAGTPDPELALALQE